MRRGTLQGRWLVCPASEWRRMTSTELRELIQTIQAYGDLIAAVLGFVGILFAGILGVYLKLRAPLITAQAEQHKAQTALANEQRQQIPNLPNQFADAVTGKLAEAIGPLAALVKSQSEALERATAKHLQLQLDHDRVCADLDNLKLDWKTQREAWQRELTAKDDKVKEANATVETLRAELDTNRSEIKQLQTRVTELEQKVEMLVTEKEQLQKERDEFKARAEKAEAENERLKKLLSQAETARSAAEATLLKLRTQPAAPVPPHPQDPVDPSDPRV
jgi:chromosome segregation ATPase